MQRPGAGSERCVRDLFRAHPDDFSASESYPCQRPTRRPDAAFITACGRILTPDIDADYQIVEDYADSPECANALNLPTGNDQIIPDERFL